MYIYIHKSQNCVFCFVRRFIDIQIYSYIYVLLNTVSFSKYDLRTTIW